MLKGSYESYIYIDSKKHARYLESPQTKEKISRVGKTAIDKL